MATMAEALLIAIRSLPREEKGKIIADLLEDAEGKEVVVEFVTSRLMNRPAAPVAEQAGYVPAPPYAERGVSPKESGKRLREKWVSELAGKGIRVDLVDSVWGQTPDGLWVGIPFATERQANHWLLGLPEAKLFDRIHKGSVALAFLCQTRSGAVLDFVLPPAKVAEIASRLSKSKGQVKFNLKKVGNRYYLGLPGPSPLDVDVSDYRSDVSVFRNWNTRQGGKAQPPAGTRQGGLVLPDIIAQQYKGM